MWSLIRNSIGSPFGWLPVEPREQGVFSDTDSDVEEDTPVDPFEPTIKDVLVVKAMLNKGLGLPLEIIDCIIDQAEYWPHTSSLVEYEPDLRVSGRSYQGHGVSEDEFLIRTPPLGFPRWPPQIQPQKDAAHFSSILAAARPPGQPLPPDVFHSLIGAPRDVLAHPCRKIVFTIRSHDQGWGGNGGDHGTYNGSWTWFEAGLERWCQAETDNGVDQQPSFHIDDICVKYPTVVSRNGDYDFLHPLDPVESLKIQCNAVAIMDTQEHRVEWRSTDHTDPNDEAAAAELSRCGRGKATATGQFVRELQLGDMVTVWAKARFPGWWNQIESVKVDVYWAI